MNKGERTSRELETTTAASKNFCQTEPNTWNWIVPAHTENSNATATQLGED